MSASNIIFKSSPCLTSYDVFKHIDQTCSSDVWAQVYNHLANTNTRFKKFNADLQFKITAQFYDYFKSKVANECVSLVAKFLSNLMKFYPNTKWSLACPKHPCDGASLILKKLPLDLKKLNSLMPQTQSTFMQVSCHRNKNTQKCLKNSWEILIQRKVSLRIQIFENSDQAGTTQAIPIRI